MNPPSPTDRQQPSPTLDSRRIALRRFALWGVVVLALGGGLAWLLSRGLSVETDITALLPTAEVDPVVHKARRLFSQRAGRGMIFLVGSASEDNARQAARTLHRLLKGSRLFARIDRKPLSPDVLARLYFPHREQLLTPETRRLLQQPRGGQRFLQQTARMLYHPLEGSFGRDLSRDPLLLYPRKLRHLAGLAGRVTVREGVRVVTMEGRSYVLLTGTLRTSPYARSTQKRWGEVLRQARQTLAQRHPDVRLRFAGMLRFAKFSADSSEKEFSVIGLGTLLGIVCLVLVTFGSLRQLVLCALPIGVGLLAAVTCLFLFFERVHVLTLVFGGSLIGVCVDYAFHYFAEQRLADERWTPMEGLRAIFPGITLGAITSMLGYLALWIAPFPGLKQMALFSTVGLLGAYGTVVCWYPLLVGSRRPAHLPATLRLSNALLKGWERPRSRRVLWILLALCSGVAGVGIAQLHTRDDIRLLYHQPQAMRDDYQRIQAATGQVGVSRFFLVEGATPEQVLRREVRLRQKLERLQKQGALSRVLGVSLFVPPRSQQQQDHRLLQRALLPDQRLERWMKRMGFKPPIVTQTLERLQAPPSSTLTIQKWQESPLSESLRHLWLGATERGVAALVQLGGVTQTAPLRALASSHAGVTFVDNVATVSAIFRRYRRLLAWLLLGAYALIVLLLGWRYGGRQTARIVGVLAWTMALTLGGLGLAGQSIDMFSMLAMLLVLGIGIDYTIFFAEARTDQRATMLAVLLSACTTILSFGLLALSTTPMLRTFGLTLFLGMVFAMLLSPLVRRPPSTTGEETEV